MEIDVPDFLDLTACRPPKELWTGLWTISTSQVGSGTYDQSQPSGPSKLAIASLDVNAHDRICLRAVIDEPE